jgi:hypothetical protein
MPIFMNLLQSGDFGSLFSSRETLHLPEQRIS